MGERPKALREVVRIGHLSAAHQHGDYGHLVATERGLDLEPDEVVRVREARPAVGVGDHRPSRAHDHQQHVALADRVLDPPHEVDPGRQVHVDEHMRLAEARHHRVIEPPGVSRRVLAAVADEQLWRYGAQCPSPPRVASS
jgi:hypothetical protein